MQQMLEQPFQPPPMFYERKPKPQPEKALVLKQQSKTGKPESKQKTIGIVKEALSAQEERYLEELDKKQQIIKHQQDMIARQHHQIQTQVHVQHQEIHKKEEQKRDKDYIELANIEKIRALEGQDKYNVLEFLVKELIQMRVSDQEGSRRKRKRRHDDSYSSSEETTPKQKRKTAKRDSSSKGHVEEKKKGTQGS